MNKTILTMAIIIAGFCNLNAQTVVLDEEVSKTIDSTKVTKEDKLSSGFMIDFTFYGGGDEKGFKGTLENSLGVNFYFNIKYKLNNTFSIVSQSGYNFESHAFKKSDTNTVFPSNIKNDMENFTVSAFVLSLGTRVNIYKKLYTEIGVMSKYNFSKVHYYQTKDVNNNLMEVYVHDLAYIKDFNHDAYVRIGYGVVNFVGYYRLNDMFQKVSYTPAVYEVPRLRLGISFGL